MLKWTESLWNSVKPVIFSLSAAISRFVTTGTWEPIPTTATGRKTVNGFILFLRFSLETQSYIAELNFPIYNFIFPKTVAAER